MSFLEWLYSTYPNPRVDGAWGALHITVLLLSIAFIVLSTIFLKKHKKIQYYILLGMAITIIAFGVVRRFNGFMTAPEYSLDRILRILLPRPGCAIACWLVAIAVFIKKKFFYNFASVVCILCTVIFFSYPSAGFTNELILFENLYSIATHALSFIMSICFITYGYTDFQYRSIWREGICLAVMLAYTFLEIYVLKIDPDPFYFRDNNDVQQIITIGYSLYLPLYLIFNTIYINAFYFIPWLKNRKKA